MTWIDSDDYRVCTYPRSNRRPYGSRPGSKHDEVTYVVRHVSDLSDTWRIS